MGKNKDKKKAHAAATAEKQKKNATRNLLKETGEASIDQILADLTAHDVAATAVTITALAPPDATSPSPRSNCSLNAHPSKPFLVLFGGEYYDGQSTSVFNDLFLFHIPSRQWRRVTSPSPPAPRSAHQAVVVTRGDEAALYVFGGEFQSPSASQFHHFSHLYALSLDSHHWTLLGGGGKSSGGGSAWPPGRSGHRMVAYSSRYLLLFGGFIDDGRDVHFLNDLWLFDLSTTAWRNVSRERKADVDHPNRWPSPRSGFCLWVDDDKNTAYLFGGMIVHKDTKKSKGGGGGGGGGEGVEEHLNDLWSLNLTSMQWTALKKRGIFPNERSGLACASVSLGSRKRALLFGGVSDEKDGGTKDAGRAKHEGKAGKQPGKRRGRSVQDGDEDEDDEEEEEEEEDRSVHFNDLFTFSMDAQHFHHNHTRGHVVTAFKQSISKKPAKDDKKDAPRPADSKDGDEPTPSTPSSIFDFNPIVDALPSPTSAASTAAAAGPAVDLTAFPCPAPRRSASLCVKDGVLWLYGGVCENDRGGREREHTFSDLWALELGGQEWKEVDKDIEGDWKGSDDEQDDEDEDEEEEKDAPGKRGGNRDEKEDEQDNEDSAPAPEPVEEGKLHEEGG